MSGSLFTLAMARLVLKMLGGELIPYTKFDGLIANRLMDEGIITIVPRGSKRSFRMIDPEGCRIYISQNYTSGMELEDWIEMKNCPDEVLRSEQVAKAGDSKLRYTRTFKGFLLNCYTPIEATFHGEPCVLSPLQGTSIFMQDYEYFRIPEDVVVVGIENGENFQHIRAQKYLFEGMKVLFVSRYPQSKDLCNWLKIIPNRYIHFGDIDLAGLSIFLNEFYVKLGNRAEFFIPADVKKRLKDGNRQLYDNQYVGDYLAKHGYVVFSADAPMWGERGRKEGVDRNKYDLIAGNMMMLGRDLSAFMTYDDISSTEFLASLPMVDAKRIGCVGCSMGAYRSWMLSALSDRIKAGASICWMITTDAQLTRRFGRKENGGFANCIPGLRQYLDYPHIASLACPKPMLFINGTKDKLFPVSGVKDAFAEMHQVWKSQGVDNLLDTELWEIPHSCRLKAQEKMLKFLDKNLK